jgi:hypothetical protein
MTDLENRLVVVSVEKRVVWREVREALEGSVRDPCGDGMFCVFTESVWVPWLQYCTIYSHTM